MICKATTIIALIPAFAGVQTCADDAAFKSPLINHVATSQHSAWLTKNDTAISTHTEQ